MNENDILYLKRAIQIAKENVENGTGGPFGAVIVKDDSIIAEGCNHVTTTNDPTAHAEVVAIRNACKSLSSFQLDDCTIYASCEPCPMCLGAIYWARPKRLVFAASKEDAAQYGFDDSFIYNEINLDYSERKIHSQKLNLIEKSLPFTAWNQSKNKTKY